MTTPYKPIPPIAPKTRPKKSQAYSQALELQRLLMTEAHNTENKGAQLASLTRAWAELEETKRKLKMRPLPKAIDVSKSRRVGQRKPMTSEAPSPTALPAFPPELPAQA